jgi:lysophospholipase L1-like esterase
MKMNRRSVAVLSGVWALGSGLAGVSLVGCSSGSSNPLAPIQAAQKANAGNFSNTVFLGDSLTAGFQSGSLLDTLQVNGWAPLVAKQGKFNIVQPLIAYPGAPNVLQLVSVNPLVITPVCPPSGTPNVCATTTGRDNFATQVTDLAVPGAVLNDVMNTVPMVTPTNGQQQLNQLVLGYPGLGYGLALSQLGQAIQAQPTTIFLWIGNNDALIADETGMPSSMTPVATFTTQYQGLMTQLMTMTPAHLVIANIPDVTAVPYLTPASLVLAEASQQSGLPTSVLSGILGIVPGDLVNPTGTAQVSAILTGTQKPPITDAGFLSAAEVVTVQAQVTAFNQVIAQQAQAAGATLVDINALFKQVTQSGLTINGYTGTTAFLGGFFALDGIHPTNTGYAVVANTFIDAMNSSIKTTIPDVSLSAVAAADPLWPPNLGHSGAHALVIPSSAGKSVEPLFKR